MAKAGLKVLLLDRRIRAGGGLTTEECTEPGFYHNLHSINHFNITTTPWYQDLQLSETVGYITPQYEFAQPHRDGSALVFSRNLEETIKNIERFSPRDAKTFREWNLKAEEMTSRIFMAERYAPPLSAQERAQILGQTALGQEFLDLTKKQPLPAVLELFENEYVRVLFLFKLSLFGTVLAEPLDNKGSPVGSLIRAFDLSAGYQLCQGGSWNLAQGLLNKFIAHGGHYRNQTQVDRIIVENNRATGIELANGEVIRARQFIASTLDVHQTFEKFIGREQLPAETRARVEAHRYTPWSIYGLHLALKEAPNYKAAAFDPNINTVLKYNIGSESVDDLMTAHHEVESKKMPQKIQFGAGALTVLDPTQAPPGKHTAYAWHVMPYDLEGNPDNMLKYQDEFADRILDKWREYAPNMTRDNVLGQYIYTGQRYAQEIINMFGGDIFMGALSEDQVMDKHFGYRTGIQGLYMAGSASHPKGGISGGSGYISAGVIAEDIGLKTWWKPVDVRDELALLKN
jgi:phytoene dehydrogenase-like protein